MILGLLRYARAALLVWVVASGLAHAGARVATASEGPMAIAALERDGRRYCKATLLDAQLAMTAAHCIQDPTQKGPDPRAVLEFPDGTRAKVRAAATAPRFFFDSFLSAPIATIHDDIAIVALDRPLPFPAINLFSFDPDRDGWVLLPTEEGTWERCPTKSWPGGVVFWIGCSRAPGDSGTPALRIEADGALNAVGIVVAQASTGGLFAHAVAPSLRDLLWASSKETVTP